MNKWTEILSSIGKQMALEEEREVERMFSIMELASRSNECVLRSGRKKLDSTECN